MTGTRLAARAGVAIALICGAFSAQAQTPPQAKPPVEAFAVLPIEPPRISPDGSRFAVVRGINGRPAVAIYKVDAPTEDPQLITSNSWIERGVRWAKNDVIITHDTRNETRGLFSSLRPFGDIVAISLGTGRMINLTGLARINDIDLGSSDTIYTSFGSMLFRANVREGGYLQVDLEPKPERGTGTAWLMDGHGNVAGRLDVVRDEKDGLPLLHTTLKVAERDAWRTLGTYDATVDQSDGVMGLSEDGQSFIRLASATAGTISVDRIDMSTAAETKLFQDPDYDVASVLDDEWTGRIIGYVIDEDTPVYRYFDPKRQALQKGLEQAFPGLSVHAVSTDLADSRAVIEVEGPKMPASYYLYDRTTHHASAIAASYPDLTESEMGDVRSYGYAARDGLHIPAYLTLPPGRVPRNLPMVVVPHGGPDARDDMGFDFIRQFLANRGYAVLQPEFRGSRGYGSAFTHAGLHQWGLKMRDDISDGVKKAIADGIADPKRVCIFGASYGGYAALAGATLTPELYACVVSMAGPSDLHEMLHYANSKFGFWSEGFWTTRIGDIDRDAGQIAAASPVLHADRVTAPVLLLHSELDVTVPIEQSEIMQAALQKAAKKVEFVRIPGDDHYMTLESTRLRVLQEVEKFLAANIGT